MAAKTAFVVLESAKPECGLPRDQVLVQRSVQLHINARHIVAAEPQNGGATYLLELDTAEHARQLIARMRALSNGFPVRCVEAPLHTLFQGLRPDYTRELVVTCRELRDTPDDMLLVALRGQGIIAARRITRYAGPDRPRTPTATIRLTVDANWAEVPRVVDFGWVTRPTRPYYPAPMLCYRCYNYGHLGAACTQRGGLLTCRNCSRQHPANPTGACPFAPFCVHCNSNSHAVSSRKCPTYQREIFLQKIRINGGLTYAEAQQQYHTGGTPTATTSGTTDSTPTAHRKRPPAAPPIAHRKRPAPPTAHRKRPPPPPPPAPPIAHRKRPPSPRALTCHCSPHRASSRRSGPAHSGRSMQRSTPARRLTRSNRIRRSCDNGHPALRSASSATAPPTRANRS